MKNLILFYLAIFGSLAAVILGALPHLPGWVSLGLLLVWVIFIHPSIVGWRLYRIGEISRWKPVTISFGDIKTFKRVFFNL